MGNIIQLPTVLQRCIHPRRHSFTPTATRLFFLYCPLTCLFYSPTNCKYKQLHQQDLCAQFHNLEGTLSSRVQETLFMYVHMYICVYIHIKCSVLLTHYYSCDKIEKNEMGGTCSAYGGKKRCIQGFGGET
jgi:hypothetical protein